MQPSVRVFGEALRLMPSASWISKNPRLIGVVGYWWLCLSALSNRSSPTAEVGRDRSRRYDIEAQDLKNRCPAAVPR